LVIIHSNTTPKVLSAGVLAVALGGDDPFT